jgi:hypothetical protein
MGATNFFLTCEHVTLILKLNLEALRDSKQQIIVQCKPLSFDYTKNQKTHGPNLLLKIRVRNVRKQERQCHP